MPAHSQRSGNNAPASKYTNKDGSKFIAVPKGTPSESSHSSTHTNTTANLSNPAANPASTDSTQPSVNRKKQKRRQKAAAKAAEQEATATAGSTTDGLNGHSTPSPSLHSTRAVGNSDERKDVLTENSGEQPENDDASQSAKKKNKKKKKKKNGGGNDSTADASSPPLENSMSGTNAQQTAGNSKDKIWSTSNHEERERIKRFWLELGEDERKSLVKVEKDAVLKKMKEQQKHTCSCTVCGRKRTAIEEELEGLYDAYYQELEQFANNGEAPPMLPASTAEHLMNSVPRIPPSGYNRHQPPARGRIVEHVTEDDEEDDLGDEIFSEDEVDDDEYSERDEPPETDEFSDIRGAEVADFLTFGNSLQVKGTQLLQTLLGKYGNMDLGGILTVADDLLKNDGKRFIDMMEQLAERRMAREEDAQQEISRLPNPPNNSQYTSHPHHHHHSHSHLTLDDEDYDEDEEDEDYEDSQMEEEEDDDGYEDEEVYSNPSVMPSKFHTECCCQDPMTEEQRMEEGRRMFQIFAARMFEQRVLNAYRDKIAEERQQVLIAEFDEENKRVEDQKARRAKNAQKKKDKAQQKRAAQAEEKARRDAERAAEEAARVEAEQERVAEQRRRAEEKRQQKEALKKAEEDARLRKEADRQRRLHEQREKQAEQERRAREAKEKERLVREEQRQREKEAREQREREAQERKEKQDRDKREKEARAARAAREAQEAKGARDKTKEAKIKANNAHTAQQPASQPIKRQPSHQAPATVPIVLPQHPSNPANQLVSPKVPVATPVISKLPTPTRKASIQYQDMTQNTSSSSNSQAASLPSQTASPHPDPPISRESPAEIQQRKTSSGNIGMLPHSVSPPGFSHGSPSMHMPPMHMQPPPGLAHHPPPGFQSRMPHDAIYPPGLRPGPNMMMPPPPHPPGMNGPNVRGFPPPLPMAPPGFAPGAEPFPIGQAFPLPQDGPPPTHARQGSASFDQSPIGSAQPIGRPTPIGRPVSGTHGNSEDKDDDTKQKHLGSRALLEDDEEPLDLETNVGSLRNQPPGPRTGFGGASFLDNLGHNPWGPPAPGSNHFPQPGFGAATWGAPAAPPGFSMGSPSMSSVRPIQPRHVIFRSLLCQAWQLLAMENPSVKEGFFDADTMKAQLERLVPEGRLNLNESDIVNICSAEGTAANGGGTFEIRDSDNRRYLRWLPEHRGNGMYHPSFKAGGAPGEIGSPIAGSASLRGT